MGGNPEHLAKPKHLQQECANTPHEHQDQDTEVKIIFRSIEATMQQLPHAMVNSKSIVFFITIVVVILIIKMQHPIIPFPTKYTQF